MKSLICALTLAMVSVSLVSCGGSSSSTPAATTTSRVLAGFVYVNSNGLGTGPSVVITTSSKAPTGYAAPSSGTVTLSVASGSLTRSSGTTLNFDMSVSNAIIVTADTAVNGNVSVSGTNLQRGGAGFTLPAFNVNVGDLTLNGTVLPFSSPNAPLYTPGPATTFTYTLSGTVPAAPKELFIAGANPGRANTGAQTLAVVGLDASGVVTSTGAFTVTGSTNGVDITGSGPAYTLTPGNASESSAEGDDTISVALSGQNQSQSFVANFSYGTITSVTVTPGANSLLWNTSGAAATTSVSAVVKNQFAAPMFNKAVALTDPGKTAAANTWATGAGATIFTAASGNTDTTGTFSTTMTAPVSAAPAGPLVLTPKGNNTITATSGTITGTATVKVIRPLDSVAIAGPARVDVGTTTPATGAQAYLPTSAVDVDGASAPLTDYPALTLTYTVTNTAGGATFGNTGDTIAKTTAAAAISSGNRVAAGNVAGQYKVQVTGGVPTNSNQVTTEVFGAPAKIFLNPNTNTTNVIAGAQGNYQKSVSSNPLNASFTFLDSFGHTIPAGEVNYTSLFSIAGSTNGNITSGGSNVNTFTLTFGNAAGLITLQTTGGTWTGAQGGTAAFNLTKTVGHDPN